MRLLRGTLLVRRSVRAHESGGEMVLEPGQGQVVVGVGYQAKVFRLSRVVKSRKG